MRPTPMIAGTAFSAAAMAGTLMLRRIAVWGGGSVLATMLSIGPATAYDFCTDLQQRFERNDSEAESLLLDNPGSTAVFASCLTVGTSRYRETHDGAAAAGAYVGCASLSCFLTDGYGNCVSVNVKFFGLILRNMQIEDQLHRSGCK